MDVNQLTKITLAWELFESGIPKLYIAQNLGVHRETVHLWIQGIKANPEGLLGFLDRYQRAKKGERTKRKVDGLLKLRIWNLREKYKGCCGQKIQEYLKQQYSLSLGVKAIYKILKEKYQLKSKWKKNQTRGPVPRADHPREVIQMDTVDFDDVFAFCGLDIFTREAEVKLYPSLTSLDGVDFLVFSFKKRFRHTDLLQTDGGSEFKDQFRKQVFLYAERYRIARPYRKNEQAYIESFNRTLRKECLGWGKYKRNQLPVLQQEVEDYLEYYHQDRLHLAHRLKTPNQILEEYKVSDF